MSREQRPEDPKLTRADELFIATRLMARARHSSKKLANAEGKPLHPELLKEIRADIAECARLALLLQAETPEPSPPVKQARPPIDEFNVCDDFETDPKSAFCLKCGYPRRDHRSRKS